jgi:uncharacterized RDD family membrane protein YckC
MADDNLNTEIRYAGFGPRLASGFLDLIIWLPIIFLFRWGTNKWRLFEVYNFMPSLALSLFYYVYLVRRFGGTPGKIMVGIRIQKLNGDAVGYREAFARFLPNFIFAVLIPLCLMMSLFQMTDAEYHSLSFLERGQRIIALAPFWYQPLSWAQSIWVWSEFIVLLTNNKRRALHDFIAGTVVVHVEKSNTTSADARQGQVG